MGIVKGRVTSRQGSPVKGVTVRGIVGGIMGGTCTAVTDFEGRFVLDYPGTGSLERVSVDGGDVEHNVRSGSSLHLFR